MGNTVSRAERLQTQCEDVTGDPSGLVYEGHSHAQPVWVGIEAGVSNHQPEDLCVKDPTRVSFFQ